MHIKINTPKTAYANDYFGQLYATLEGCYENWLNAVDEDPTTIFVEVDTEFLVPKDFQRLGDYNPTHLYVYANKTPDEAFEAALELHLNLLTDFKFIDWTEVTGEYQYTEAPLEVGGEEAELEVRRYVITNLDNIDEKLTLFVRLLKWRDDREEVEALMPFII